MFAIIVACILLIGCSAPRRLAIDDVPKLPTGVEGAPDFATTKLRETLSNQGVKIISMGQNYLISIPSSLLFADQSPKIEWGAYALLNNVACYLQQFRKISVHVNAYSTPYVSRQRDLALTRTRALAVSKYLWSRGIDSRFIFAQGLGSDKPIVALSKKGDISLNSRIEITFQNAVA